jgi:hypothetical protein
MFIIVTVIGEAIVWLNGEISKLTEKLATGEVENEEADLVPRTSLRLLSFTSHNRISCDVNFHCARREIFTNG